MNRSFGYRGLALGVILVTLVLTPNLFAQKKTTSHARTAGSTTLRYPYQHGYHTGYDDGFIRGRSDFHDARPRDFAGCDAYQRADRSYQESMGSISEYQEGYRIGFELGYNDGYYGRPKSPAVPVHLAKVIAPPPAPVASASGAESGPQSTPQSAPQSGPQSAPVQSEPVQQPQAAPSQDAAQPPQLDQHDSGSRGRTTLPASNSRRPTVIPDGVPMKIRLTSPISTRTNQQGDRFTAVVLDPSDYAEAELTGHIGKLTRSGKATGKTEMALVFDTIRLRDGRTGRFSAQVERVYQSESVKTVDTEGNIESSDQTKDTAIRGAGAGALGAIIGGIAGGGKGAAIGGIVGATMGAGSVLLQNGKDLILDPGTEMLIRSTGPSSRAGEGQ
jgi:outer membrane lipoprotein SlyB